VQRSFEHFKQSAQFILYQLIMCIKGSNLKNTSISLAGKWEWRKAHGANCQLLIDVCGKALNYTAGQWRDDKALQI
jgi:hypothetical protein